MFGSRKTTGAIIIPATAPSTVAKPQPNASIQPTRTPASRDESGLTAAARSASPSFVKRKNSPSMRTSANETTTMPMSCTLIGTPPTSIVRVENGPLNCLLPPPQIRFISPFRSSASPSVTITIVITGAFSTGRISTRSIVTPPANAIASTIGNAAQKERPWFVSDQATNVVKVAISPCAKLITRVDR